MSESQTEHTNAEPHEASDALHLETQWSGKSPGRIDSTTVAVVGIVLTILVIVVIVAGQAWYYSYEQTKLEEEIWPEVDPKRVKYEDEQQRLLSETKAHKEGISVPIQDAMNFYIADYNKKLDAKNTPPSE